MCSANLKRWETLTSRKHKQTVERKRTNKETNRLKKSRAFLISLSETKGAFFLLARLMEKFWLSLENFKSFFRLLQTWIHKCRKSEYFRNRKKPLLGFIVPLFWFSVPAKHENEFVIEDDSVLTIIIIVHHINQQRKKMRLMVHQQLTLRVVTHCLVIGTNKTLPPSLSLFLSLSLSLSLTHTHTNTHTHMKARTTHSLSVILLNKVWLEFYLFHQVNYVLLQHISVKCWWDMH